MIANKTKMKKKTIWRAPGSGRSTVTRRRVKPVGTRHGNMKRSRRRRVVGLGGDTLAIFGATTVPTRAQRTAKRSVSGSDCLFRREQSNLGRLTRRCPLL